MTNLQVGELIDEAKVEWEKQEHGPEDQMMLPLIRLKVSLKEVLKHMR